MAWHFDLRHNGYISSTGIVNDFTDVILRIKTTVRNSIIEERTQIEAVMLTDSLIGRSARVIGREQSLTLNIGDSSEIIID